MYTAEPSVLRKLPDLVMLGNEVEEELGKLYHSSEKMLSNIVCTPTKGENVKESPKAFAPLDALHSKEHGDTVDGRGTSSSPSSSWVVALGNKLKSLQQDK